MMTESLFTRLFLACPAKLRRAYLEPFSAALSEFGITTPARIAAFAAQVGHESADFKYMQEIASGSAYEGRRDLGNTQPGDGRKFKGRGPIQITGRANYLAAGKALGLPLTDSPELLAQPEHAFRAAAWFWKTHKLNELADRLTLSGDAQDLQQFDRISRVINGGTNGRADRRRRYEIARKAVAMPLPPHQGSTPPEASAAISATALPIPSEVPHAVEPPILDNELVSKVTASAGARAAGKSALTKVGLRLGRPLALVYATLEAGNIYAWLGVVALVVGAGVLIYFERGSIKKGLLWIAAKAKASK
jgi:predicted chitinase